MRPLAVSAAAAGLLLAAAGLPAEAAGPQALRVAEEFALLDGGPGQGVQGTPRAAWGGGVYLAVWREGWHGKGGRARIWAARISADGKVLDRDGIDIAPRPEGVQERPRVAFGGGVFLVTWQELANGKDYDVSAARITPQGRVLDAPPIAVAAGPRNQVLPDVASDGKDFLIVWQGLQGEETAYRGLAAAVGADGKVGPCGETGVSPQPQIAWNGRSYLAAYGSQKVLSVLLSSEGKPLNPSKWGNETLCSTKAAAIAVTGVPGRGWLVVGHRSPPDPWGWGGPGAVRVALVDNTGKVENQTAVKEPSGNWQKLAGWLDLGKEKKAGATWPWGEAACAWTGKHVLVVWQRHHLAGEKFTTFENGDLMAARVDGFTPLDEEGIAVASGPLDETRPALASDGAGRLLCVYETHGAEGGDRVVGRMILAP